MLWCFFGEDGEVVVYVDGNVFEDVGVVLGCKVDWCDECFFGICGLVCCLYCNELMSCGKR